MNYLRTLLMLVGALAFPLLASQDFSTADVQISLIKSLKKQLLSRYSNLNVNVQYKCWAYDADVGMRVENNWSEREICRATLRAIQALARALPKSAIHDQLYYEPSNLYLYKAFVSDLGSHLMLFVQNGEVELVKQQRFLTAKERELYKDQLATDPRYYNDKHQITIWKKSFEEVSKDVNFQVPEIKRDPEYVFNFSENPAIREAALIVEKRILDRLKTEGYGTFTSVSKTHLALRNKEGPYHWMFFLDKSLPKLQSYEESPVPYSIDAYREEYKRLHKLVVDMINEAPELTPYLKRPVNSRDVEFSFAWEQKLVIGDAILDSYSHCIFRTHSKLIMERIHYGPGSVVKESKLQSFPLEEFFQSIGI